MSARSSKLGDVLNQGAGLDIGIALASNMSVSACLSVSLCLPGSGPHYIYIYIPTRLETSTVYYSRTCVG